MRPSRSLSSHSRPAQQHPRKSPNTFLTMRWTTCASKRRRNPTCHAETLHDAQRKSTRGGEPVARECKASSPIPKGRRVSEKGEERESQAPFHVSSRSLKRSSEAAAPVPTQTQSLSHKSVQSRPPQIRGIHVREQCNEEVIAFMQAILMKQGLVFVGSIWF